MASEAIIALDRKQSVTPDIVAADQRRILEEHLRGLRPAAQTSMVPGRTCKIVEHGRLTAHGDATVIMCCHIDRNTKQPCNYKEPVSMGE